MSNLERLFYPKAVGIIGANKEFFGGGYFLKCLEFSKYDKPIYLFNPRLKGELLDGIKVYSSIMEIPEEQPIDYAIIAVRAQYCPQVLEECGKKKVPYVCIFTSGFSEVGNYELEKEISDIARRYNVRVIGPNCLGVHSPKGKLVMSLFPTKEEGELGIISQSGTLSNAIIGLAETTCNTYISKLISIGNQIDLNVVDFLKYFLTDNDTQIIGMYLENIKGQKAGSELIETVRQLSLEKQKPVIILKVGFYGESAKEAIISHTGGMAGSPQIWEAFAKQSGAILVQSTKELVTLAMGFKYLDISQINRNISVIAVGGGTTIELTDHMEMHNLKVPKLSENTKNQLQEFLPSVNTILRNPLDLGVMGGNPENLRRALITLDKDPNISVIVFIQPYRYDNAYTKAIIGAKSEMKKPLICVANQMIEDTNEYRSKLRLKKEAFKVGIPIFGSIDLTAKALDRMCSFKEFLERHKNNEN